MKKQYPSKMGKNGQVVLPKELRDLMRMGIGDQVIFDVDTSSPSGLKIEVRKASPNTTSLIGTLGHLSTSSYEEYLKKINQEEGK